MLMKISEPRLLALKATLQVLHVQADCAYGSAVRYRLQHPGMSTRHRAWKRERLEWCRARMPVTASLAGA